MDTPDERKHHIGSIPLIGGIAIYIGFSVSCFIFLPLSRNLLICLFSLGLITFVGIFDDYKGLSVKVRFFLQTAVALMMALGAGVCVDTLGNLLGLGEIELNSFAVFFTVISAIGVMNAVNMMDGIDGLAGGISLISLLTLLVLVPNGNISIILLLAILMASILPYLIFNLGLFGVKNKRVFLGDAGSMFIGYVLVWQLVYCTQLEQPYFSPAVALWVIAVPLLDMFAVLTKRIIRKQAPFRPRRDHFHHTLLQAGCSDKQTLIIILSIAVGLSGFGLLGSQLLFSEAVLFLVFMIIFILHIFCAQIIKMMQPFFASKPIKIKV